MYRRTIKLALKRKRRKTIRYGLLIVNILVLGSVTVLVVRNRTTSHNLRPATAIFETEKPSNPLDQVSSADIAVHVAQLVGLAETVAVVNLADSKNAELILRVDDAENIIFKPQIIGTNLKSRKDLKKYITVEGDTVSSLATKFGITSETIRWSNSLSISDALPIGKELFIAPVNGVVYVVKQGDSLESLAQRFRASQEIIVSFNDLEVSGIKPGETIVIPDGKLPSQTRAFESFSWGGNAPIYNGNGYDYGFCTWWVAVRRQQIGRPVPSNLGNAVTWKSLAPRAGLGTGNTPLAGAVIWTDPAIMSGYYRSYGHVGFVEKINDDGSVWVSDMNSSGYAQMDTSSGRGGGWGRTSYRLLSPEQAKGFTYIY